MLPCRPAHAVHFAVYEAAKKGLGETVAETSFAGAAAAGAAATIVSDACMTPFDVIKQRLQVSKLPACWWSVCISSNVSLFQGGPGAPLRDCSPE